MKSNELLKTVQAFLGSMRDGDMKGVVANLQAAMEYQAEELRIYKNKYKGTSIKLFFKRCPIVSNFQISE